MVTTKRVEMINVFVLTINHVFCFCRAMVFDEWFLITNVDLDFHDLVMSLKNQLCCFSTQATLSYLKVLCPCLRQFCNMFVKFLSQSILKHPLIIGASFKKMPKKVRLRCYLAS